MSTSIVAWTGTREEITPPETAQFLADALKEVVPVEVRMVKGAGHFSFMNTPPPHAKEPLANREAFLEDLAGQMVSFIED